MLSGKKIKKYFICLRIGKAGLCSAVTLLFFIFPEISLRECSAFTSPEKLIFDLTWTGVKAGTATLETVIDKEQTKIISTANSADWVSVFYKVEDRIESLLKKTQTASIAGLPENYRVKLREGKHRRDKEIIFDHPNRRAVFIDHLGPEKKTFTIRENTFDPLSSFYYIRTLKYEVGKSVYVDIFDSKKLWNVEVQVIRRERIKTELGEFDTVVIKPLMKSEGIFNRKGDMYIWLTDDLKRVPVKMQTKVAVGSVTATLVRRIY